MSSPHDHQIERVEPHSKDHLRNFGDESSESRKELPESEVGNAPIPFWLLGVIGLGIFWAGAYLFSFSGGFKADVFDHEPKFGVQTGGSKSAPDPKIVGKALFSSNCITCHQATGQGMPGQYPPLVGSEVVLGEATNHLIAIVLKGLQGPVTVKGQTFNNAMQAWEAQYTDQQLAAILTYIRSDWGNSAPPITADMVKQVRDEVKDRKDQWTWAEIKKIPPKNLTTGGGGNPPQDQQPAATPAPGAPLPPVPAQSPASGSK